MEKKLLLSIALKRVLREWGYLILHALEGKWREHFDVSEGRQMLSTFWLYLARQSDLILCRSEPNQHLYSPFVESSQVSWVFLVVSSLRNLMWACLYYLLLCCCIWEVMNNSFQISFYGFMYMMKNCTSVWSHKLIWHYGFWLDYL